jgi:hypothetical protein
MTSPGGPPLVASNASFEAALEPVKLFQGIGKGDRHVGNRLTVQPLCLDKPGTSGRIPERAFKVARGLGVVVGALPAGRVASCNPQPTESGVVDDHIRLPQHQILAITYIGVCLVRHVEHAGTTEGGESWAARRAAVSSARVGARPR